MELELLHKVYVAEWPSSDWRPRIDLYAALAKIGQGHTQAGVSQLTSLSQSETFEDVKADACHHLALHFMNASPPVNNKATAYFEKSIRFYPRERSCLAAAKLYVKLQQWDKARALLHRVIREFPRGDPRAVSEAKSLLQVVLKRIAESPKKKRR